VNATQWMGQSQGPFISTCLAMLYNHCIFFNLCTPCPLVSSLQIASSDIPDCSGRVGYFCSNNCFHAALSLSSHHLTTPYQLYFKSFKQCMQLNTFEIIPGRRYSRSSIISRVLRDSEPPRKQRTL